MERVRRQPAHTMTACTWRPRSLVAAATAAALSVLTATATAAPPAQAAGPVPAARPAAGPVRCDTDLGSRLPVLLVHGFNSAASTWDGGRAAIGADGAHTCLADFDYGPVSTRWVTDPAIGQGLATRILNLAQQSKDRNGPGKVFVVAHSMGGLAIRCAADPKCSKSPDVAAKLAGVVTFGTPNDGTYLKAQGRSLVANWIAARLDPKLCFIAWRDSALCQIFSAFFTSPAAKAFTPGSRELDDLPDLDSTVPVYAVSGSIPVTTQIFTWKGQIADVGDAVVDPPSALAAANTVSSLGGKKVIPCGHISLSVLDGPSVGVTCTHISETAALVFTRAAAAQIALAVDAPRVVLRENGQITVDGVALASMSPDAAIRTVAAVLGKPSVNRWPSTSGYSICDTHEANGTAAIFGGLQILAPAVRQPEGMAIPQGAGRVAGWTAGLYGRDSDLSAATDRGIKLGSTLAQVRNAYPGGSLSGYDGSQLYVPPNSDLRFGFDETNPTTVLFMSSGFSCGT